MKIFTINSGSVSEGVIVEKLTLKGAGIEIPAIVIGEEGRGRERGVFPVQLTSAQQKEWEEKGKVTVKFVQVGQTKAGKPKLFAFENDDLSDHKATICVFRTKMGFRGGNSHTGDRTGEEQYEDWGVQKTRITFAPFPGEIIVRGMIAEGAAGRMGSGDQLVALIPDGAIFRTSYSGRLYGSPSSHYYKCEGGRILGGLTWDDRSSSDLF